jgi:hypothetical protein
MKTGRRGHPPKGNIKISQCRWEEKSAFEAIRAEIIKLVGNDWQPTRFFTSSELNFKYERWYRRDSALKALQDLEQSGKIESLYDPNFNETYLRLK